MLAKETVAFLGGSLRSDRQKDSAAHGLGDQPGGPRSGRAGARYLQRRLSPVAEQRRRLARARTRGQGSHGALTHSLSYDLDELATAIATALNDAAGEALVRWAADAIPVIPYPSLSRTLRVMGVDGAEPRHIGEHDRCLPPPGR